MPRGQPVRRAAVRLRLRLPNTPDGAATTTRPGRAMLHTRWSAEAWSQVRVEFGKALAVRSEIRRAGWVQLAHGSTVSERGLTRSTLPVSATGTG